VAFDRHLEPDMTLHQVPAEAADDALLGARRRPLVRVCPGPIPVARARSSPIDRIAFGLLLAYLGDTNVGIVAPGLARPTG
jgi:hypothetical protein